MEKTKISQCSIPRIINIENLTQAIEEIKKIGADSKSFDIMAPKSVFKVLKLKSIPAYLCNILKQQMLSLGGEVAVSKKVINAETNISDCIIMGTLSQIKKLCRRLEFQPWGLKRLALRINESIENYSNNEFILSWRNFKFDFRKRTYIMGILNLTPDSFSGNGVYKDKITLEKIVDIAQKIQQDGADILDIGGESTRPYAKKISQQEEERRVLPVIKKLAKVLRIPISIDTYKSIIAKKALDNGASLVNDITALNGDKDMANIVAKYKVPLVLMHMKGTPRTMQKNPVYKCLMGEIISSLNKCIKKAEKAGIDKDKIIIDPGIGFGKTTLHNLIILNNLNELKVLGHPVLIGVSRKSLIGNVLNLDVNERLLGGCACVAVAIIKGANIVRVHDVAQIKQIVSMVDAIKNKV